MPAGDRHAAIRALHGVHHTAATRSARSGSTQRARTSRVASVEGPAAHPMGPVVLITRAVTTGTMEHVTMKQVHGHSIVNEVGSTSVGAQPSATAASSASRAAGPRRPRALRRPHAKPNLDHPGNCG